jgi:purine-binding chemotaxis protein CheW
MTEETLKILEARARTLARTPADVELSGDDALVVLEFLLAGERYALESRHLRELCPLKDLTPLPNTPPFVLGIMNLRGQILPVIDFRRFVGFAVRGITELNRVIILRSDDRVFGLLADEIIGMRTLARRQVRQQPFRAGMLPQFIMGIAPDGCIVLDGGKILADRQIVVEEEENS